MPHVSRRGRKVAAAVYGLGQPDMPTTYYKQVFAHTFPDLALDDAPGGEWISLRPDGQLQIGEGDAAYSVDIGESAGEALPVILDTAFGAPSAQTPDGSVVAALQRLERYGRTEYWLTLQAEERVRRFKLVWEAGKNGENSPPTLGVTAGGGYFVVDDDGIIRLYESSTFAEAGAFQAAHPSTPNRVQRIVGSDAAGLLCVLTSWKHIVLYSMAERRPLFVRQIHDPVVSYEPGTARLLVTPEGGLIVAGGFGRTYNAPSAAVTVSAFRRLSHS